MAKCSKCNSKEDVFVWYVPDPINDYPHFPEMICGQCPKPTDIFKDCKARYDPDFHGEMFGHQNYSMGLARMFCGPDDVKGICFECDGPVNMSQGYGYSYVDQKYWQGGNRQCNVAYCVPCYRERCKNHIEGSTKEEEYVNFLEKLHSYWNRTEEGRIKSANEVTYEASIKK